MGRDQNIRDSQHTRCIFSASSQIRVKSEDEVEGTNYLEKRGLFNIEAITSEASFCSVLFSLSINKSVPDIANSSSFEAFRKLGNFGQCGDRKLLNRTAVIHPKVRRGFIF